MKLRLSFVAPARAARFVILTALAVLALAAGSSNHPGACRDYRTRYVDPKAKDDPKDGRMRRISEFSLWSEDGSYEGKPATVFKREERSTQGDRVLFEVTAASDLLPFQTNRKVYSRQNQLLEDHTIVYTDLFSRFPARTIDGATMSWALEHIDLTIGRRSDFWIALGTEFAPWQVFMTPEAEETVTVPAGTFKCVRVKLKYSTDKLPGFLKMLPRFILNQIISSPTGWVTKDTHIMVKFQDKLDGPGTPDKVEELVRIR